MTGIIIGLIFLVVWMLSHLGYLRGDRPEGFESLPLRKVLLFGAVTGLFWSAIIACLVNGVMWIFHLQ